MGIRVEGRTALAWRRGRYVPLSALRGPRPVPLELGASAVSLAELSAGGDFGAGFAARARLHSFADAYLVVGHGDDGAVLTGAKELVSELGAYTQIGQRQAPFDLRLEPQAEALTEIVVGFDGACRNYYHWLINALGRAWLASEFMPGATVVLPDFRDRGDGPGQARREVLQASAEAAFGDRPYRLLAPGLYAVNKLHALWTRPTSPTEITSFPRLYALFDRIAEQFGGWPERRRRRLYISRRDAHDGRLPREDAGALDVVLARHGFETLLLEQMSFEAQVRAAAQAQIIVAPHGAGLTNMVFSHREAIIVELASVVNGEAGLRPWFCQLATSRGQRYGAFKVGSAGWLQDLDAALARRLR